MIIAMNSFISPNVIAAEPSLNGVSKGNETALDMLEHAEKGKREGVTKIKLANKMGLAYKMLWENFLGKN